jgi:APA family basic amino acid/polyamine antiporter
MANLLATKPMDLLLHESKEEGEHTLRRALGPLNLVTLGIGAIIGAGIFVLTGQAAAQHAGPAIVLSFVLAGIACAFAGLCYAEFASLIPIAGSAYTYGYATLGEIFAWIIGWDLVLEYALGAATVASGWSGYFVSFLQDFGIYIPPQLTAVPGAQLAFYNERWVNVNALPAGVDIAGLPQATGVFNLVAFFIVLVVTAVLVIGIKESANLNSAIVVVKVGIVLMFIGIATVYILRNPGIAAQNWSDFIPANAGKYGEFGWSGIATGAAVVFFAYIGFDAVSTAAQEAKNPQKDMPVGILGSLAVCTVLYILVAGLLTGMVNYRQLNVPDPVAVGIDVAGIRWGSFLVKLGAIFGLGTVMLVMLLGQSRVFYSMSRDNLLPAWVSKIHPRFRTPWVSTILVGVAVAFLPGFLPISDLGHLVSIGTLFAFVIVCAGVWILRRRRPELHRPFKTPAVPLVPILGIVVSLGLMASLPLPTWERLMLWLLAGLLIYFSYGAYNSRVQRSIGTPPMPANPTALGLGIAGSLLLAAGAFTPIFSTPAESAITYFSHAFWLGVIVLLLAVNGLLISGTRQFAGLWIIGGFAVALMALSATALRSGLVHEGATAAAPVAVSFAWGWALLILGTALLFAAAAKGKPVLAPRPPLEVVAR